jgi:hypothetical protein
MSNISKATVHAACECLHEGRKYTVMLESQLPIIGTKHLAAGVSISHLPEYMDIGIDNSVLTNKIKKNEKLKDIKRRRNWIKRNSEIMN